MSGFAPVATCARPSVPVVDSGGVLLDPAVELLDSVVAGYRLMVHDELETALAIPPGEGLLDLVADLAAGPVARATLYARYADPALVDRVVDGLIDAGFAVAGDAPSSSRAWREKRRVARARHDAARRRLVTIDLDAAGADQAIDALSGEPIAPELVLRCARLADHADRIARLAARRRAGQVRLYDSTIRTRDLKDAASSSHAILALGAAVVVEDVAWPAPAAAIPGLADLTGRCIAVHLAMAPGSDPRETMDRAGSWASAAGISGLRLRLDPATFWPSGGASDADFAALFADLEALEACVGDVLIENLPSDEMLLGAAPAPPRGAESDLLRRFRRAYLRWRIPYLKACEGDNLWSQIPEVEDKLVRLEDDLLPNHPALLGLGPGSRVVDVCGGLGRVARRLSPLVGPDGLIVSIEMLRLLSARARDFATARGFTNLSFRPGLAQRLPLPDGAMDAAVNEWTGAIWELGIGPAMLTEMARVVRPGGRIAVTHRLVRLPLARLAEPWVQYDAIDAWIRAAFDAADLPIVVERIWGQIAPSLIGETATLWRKQYVRSVVDPYAFTYDSEVNAGRNADVFVTFIAEKPL